MSRQSPHVEKSSSNYMCSVRVMYLLVSFPDPQQDIISFACVPCRRSGNETMVLYDNQNPDSSIDEVSLHILKCCQQSSLEWKIKPYFHLPCNWVHVYIYTEAMKEQLAQTWRRAEIKRGSVEGMLKGDIPCSPTPILHTVAKNWCLTYWLKYIHYDSI